jgi:hypothetical protein
MREIRGHDAYPAFFIGNPGGEIPSEITADSQHRRLDLPDLRATRLPIPCEAPRAFAMAEPAAKWKMGCASDGDYCLLLPPTPSFADDCGWNGCCLLSKPRAD